MSTNAATVAPPETVAQLGRVAVIAHRRKSLGGGLDELRAALAGAGIDDVLWYEVSKSRKAGFDGDLIRAADRELKGRFGRLAYVWAGLRHVRGELVRTRIRVDGVTWFDGEASCVLFGNVGTITGGIPAFDDARPDDGCLEVGVSTASGAIDWARTLGRMAAGRSTDSPFVRITRGRRVSVRFDAPRMYELDGGARTAVRKLKVRSMPGALTVCCPELAA